jgi:hypothetical protein
MHGGQGALPPAAPPPEGRMGEYWLGQYERGRTPGVRSKPGPFACRGGGGGGQEVVRQFPCRRPVLLTMVSRNSATEVMRPRRWSTITKPFSARLRM